MMRDVTTSISTTTERIDLDKYVKCSENEIFYYLHAMKTEQIHIHG